MTIARTFAASAVAAVLVFAGGCGGPDQITVFPLSSEHFEMTVNGTLYGPGDDCYDSLARLGRSDDADPSNGFLHAIAICGSAEAAGRLFGAAVYLDAVHGYDPDYGPDNPCGWFDDAKERMAQTAGETELDGPQIRLRATILAGAQTCETIIDSSG